MPGEERKSPPLESIAQSTLVQKSHTQQSRLSTRDPSSAGAVGGFFSRWLLVLRRWRESRSCRAFHKRLFAKSPSPPPPFAFNPPFIRMPFRLPPPFLPLPCCIAATPVMAFDFVSKGPAEGELGGLAFSRVCVWWRFPSFPGRAAES